MSTLLVAFLTGQSEPSHNALSPLQARFLQALAGADRELWPLNFPYHKSGPFRDTGLLRASWNNALLYLRSRSSSLSLEHRPSVEALLRRHTRAFLLLGSCGLELFNNLQLPEDLERRCSLVCYGPVARRLPRFARHTLVRGRRDFIMRLPGSHAAIPVPCGHLDYLENPEFLALCLQRLSEWEGEWKGERERMGERVRETASATGVHPSALPAPHSFSQEEATRRSVRPQAEGVTR